MRVLCSTPPIEGVFGPFIPLGRALVEAGHDLIVASGPDLKARTDENGMRLEETGLTAMEGAIRGFADPEVKAAPPGDRISFPSAMFGSVIPAAKLAALRALADSHPPDLIVHPPVDLAGPLLAAELRLPSVCYGFAQPFDPEVLAAIARRARPLWTAAGLEPDAYAGVVYRHHARGARGPPLVLVPRGADQFDNARACQQAGAARVLAPDQVSAAAVRAVLPATSAERQAAQAVASEIAAMPSAADVAHRLAALNKHSTATA